LPLLSTLQSGFLFLLTAPVKQQMRDVIPDFIQNALQLFFIVKADFLVVLPTKSAGVMQHNQFFFGKQLVFTDKTGADGKILFGAGVVIAIIMSYVTPCRS